MSKRQIRLLELAKEQNANIVGFDVKNVLFECYCGERATKGLSTTNLRCKRHTASQAHIKRDWCSHFENYTFPSGKTIRINKGYEGSALAELVQLYDEDDIITTPEPIAYTLDGKLHTYIPDVYIKSKNLIIEVKSDRTMYWLGKYNANLAKRKAAKDAGYNFEFWIYDKYTKTIL